MSSIHQCHITFQFSLSCIFGVDLLWKGMFGDGCCVLKSLFVKSCQYVTWPAVIRDSLLEADLVSREMILQADQFPFSKSDEKIIVKKR
jgi:hypothetical protein